MKTIIEIQNLKCGGCEKTITDNLSKIAGVSDVIVDHETSTVNLEYVSEDSLRKVIEKLSKLGYPVTGEKNDIGKKATSYVSCMIGKITS